MPICRRILAATVLVSTLAVLPGCGKKQSAPSVGSEPKASLTSADAAGPWRMELKVIPDHPNMTKPITFLVHITDDHGQPVNDAEVNGSLAMKSMDMGATALKFAAKGNGDYEASVKNIDMSGPWNLAIDAAQGSTHGKKNFDVTVYD